MLLLMWGCPGSSSSYSPPPSPTPLPQYEACISTVPVDAANPNEPVITLTGPRVISQPLGAAYADAGATASDPHDGNITSQIVVTGLASLDVNTVGDYLVRYNVTDSAQLPAVEVVRLVRVDAGTFAEQMARDIGSTSAHLAYYEHLPVNYSADPAQTFPLIVFRHGWGGARFTADGTGVQSPLSELLGSDMAGLINQGLWDDSRPFIVLSPQQCVDPLTFVVTAYQMKLFIDYAINTYKVDTSRIYMAGYSQGSGNTWDYVNNYPQQLAAVVPMSGGYGTSVGCMLKQTPAWAFGAADDTVVPYQNQVDTVDSINACNPVEPAKLTVFPSGGHSTVEEFMTINLTGLGEGLPAYDIYNQSIYDWLLDHSRTAPSPLSVGRTGTVRVSPSLDRPALLAAGATFTVTPSAILWGRSATLQWSAEGAVSCLASGDWVGRRPASGTESVRPPAPGSYGYVLTCEGPGGAVSRSVTLTVGKAPDPKNLHE
ncbi:MAG: immunoglobulin-like domain-containing protein [Bryobacteraceae bacterium]